MHSGALMTTIAVSGVVAVSQLWARRRRLSAESVAEAGQAEVRALIPAVDARQLWRRRLSDMMRPAVPVCVTGAAGYFAIVRDDDDTAITWVEASDVVSAKYAGAGFRLA